MNKQITTLIIGIFLLIPVSAIYGGETYSIEIEFEPVACSVTDNLSYEILGKNVNIELPINFLGNFTLTCFNGEEASPVIVYRGGGGGGTRTRYVDRNVTEYVDKIVEVEKIVEVKIPVETKGGIEYINGWSIQTKILVSFLTFIIMFLLIWNVVGYIAKGSEMEVEDYNYRIKKGGENKNE